MPNITHFETRKHHIHTKLFVRSHTGTQVSFMAIIDTGAPFTELSDQSLARAGYETPPSMIETQALQETQKYAKICLPQVTVLGQQLENWIVYISRFDAAWHIDALIGLDFFRRFRMTIDYRQGQIITEPLSAIHP